jgi:hypothetical protein
MPQILRRAPGGLSRNKKIRRIPYSVSLPSAQALIAELLGIVDQSMCGIVWVANNDAAHLSNRSNGEFRDVTA